MKNENGLFEHQQKVIDVLKMFQIGAPLMLVLVAGVLAVVDVGVPVIAVYVICFIAIVDYVLLRFVVVPQTIARFRKENGV